MTKKPKNSLKQCEFCGNEFKTEKGYEKHLCTKKKRWLLKDTKEFLVGYELFCTYYRTNIRSKKVKTAKEFVKSRYYTDFYNLGKFVLTADLISKEDYVQYLYRNEIRSNLWCSDSTYNEYVRKLLETETPMDALERSMLTMLNWSKNTGLSWSEFFKQANPNAVMFMIRDGKISPWILYVAESADVLFDKFNAEHYKLLSQVINEKFWKTKLTSYRKDVIFIKSLLREAGM